MPEKDQITPFEFLIFLPDAPSLDEVVGGEQVRPFEFLRWIENRGLHATVWCVRPRADRRRRGHVTVRHLTPNGVGAIRELVIWPLALYKFVVAVLRARYTNRQPVLWSRVPSGVVWRYGYPVVSDPSILLFPVARLLRVPIWASNHDISPDHEEDKISQRRAAGVIEPGAEKAARRSGRANAWLQKFAFRRVTMVTTVSEGTRSLVIDRFALDPAKVSIVRAGAAAELGDISEWQPPHQLWRIGFVGSLADAQTNLLFATLRDLAVTNEPVSVVLAGRGFDLIDTTALPESIPVTISPDARYAQLPALATSVDLWLVPLGTEGYHSIAWPLKVPMYMATGRPVVINDHPEVRAAGVETMVVRAPASSTLADTIRGVIQDPATAQACARRARQHALDNLSWAHAFDSALEGLKF